MYKSMMSKLLLIALIPLMFVSCDSIFDEGDVERSYDGPPVVAFFPLETTARVSNPEVALEVQLIAPQREADLDVFFEVDTEASTAVEGTHFQFVDASPVTIEAGTSTTDLNIELLEDEDTEEEVLLVLNITRTSADVEPAENLRRANIFIRP